MRDKNVIINKTKDLKIHKDAILDSFDVQSLYTGIPNSESRAVAKRAFNECLQKAVSE